MAKVIKWITLICGLIFGGLTIAYHLTWSKVILPIAITALTFFYHFAMRLVVGLSINAIFKNKFNYTKAWFKEKNWEKKFFDFIKIKKWKKHLPTYAPSAFDPKQHSLEEILGASCQAEIVHEIIMVLSFLPILLIIPFGEIAVFVTTSIIACLFDSLFVILQRYNRPRLIKIIERNNKKTI